MGLVYVVLLMGVLVAICRDRNMDVVSTERPSGEVDGQSVGGIYKDVVCRQYFEIPVTQKLQAVEIQFATYCDTIDTDGVIFTLYKDGNRQLYSTTISGDNLWDGGYYKVELPETYHSWSGEFYFTITGTDERSDKVPPTIWGSVYEGASKELYINDELQPYQMNVIYTCIKDAYRRPVIWGMQLLLCILMTLVTIPRIKDKKCLHLIQLSIFVANILVIEEVTEELGMSGVAMNTVTTCMTYVLIASVQLVLLGVLGSVTRSVIVTDIILFAVALTNYFVMLYRGTPIVPLDIFSVRTLSSVIDSYSIRLTTDQMLAIMWLLLFIRGVLDLSYSAKHMIPTDEKTRGVARRVGMCILSVLIGLIGIMECGSSKVLAKANIEANTWARDQGYYSNGVFMNFMVNAQCTKMKKPKGYTREKAEEILARYELDGEAAGASPNIIIIMNESLTDYDDYESDALSLNRDPLPFLHSMTENTVKGRCYVSIFGSGTSNSELEALTGHSMAFFPSGSVVYQQFSVYDSMGFQSFWTDEEFQNAEVVRWTSDRATYDKVIEAYEEKKAGEPLFVMGSTFDCL